MNYMISYYLNTCCNYGLIVIYITFQTYTCFNAQFDKYDNQHVMS